MSDEHFLARWSRRKHEAAVESAAPAKPDDADAQPQPATGEEVRPPARDVAAAPAQAVPAGFDPATLPSLDSITATTDVRGFLASGVPNALAREALRRAWVADPAIRDFRGLQEYDWDFTDPEAVPGFGTIGSDYDVKGLVAKIFGEGPREQEAAAVDPAAGQRQPIVQTGESDPADKCDADEAALLSHSVGPSDPLSGTVESQAAEVANQQPEELVHRNKEAAAESGDLSDNSGQRNRRSHGGALPKS